MTLDSDAERRLYLQGIRLFNEHEFFEAHEVWEDVWNAAYGLKHDFYQGLIQCAVALEHYRRSNPRGVVGLHQSYNRKFRLIPGVFMGLDVASFLAGMEAALKPVTQASPLPKRGQIALDPSTVPVLRLLYDPFETGEATKYARPEEF
jgi:uncharacterized protein